MVAMQYSILLVPGVVVVTHVAISLVSQPIFVLLMAMLLVTFVMMKVIANECFNRPEQHTQKCEPWLQML